MRNIRGLKKPELPSQPYWRAQAQTSCCLIYKAMCKPTMPGTARGHSELAFAASKGDPCVGVGNLLPRITRMAITRTAATTERMRSWSVSLLPRHGHRGLSGALPSCDGDVVHSPRRRAPGGVQLTVGPLPTLPAGGAPADPATALRRPLFCPDELRALGPAACWLGP